MSDLADGPSARRQGSEHLPALDGIRAFAVTAVILYHFGVAGVSGGLLGVDVFFVLSGFLITSLLCGEHLKRGTIRLGQFWARRARRLLPGLFLLLLGVAVYAWAFRNSVDVATIRGDAIATLLYFANWHFIFANQSYFAQSAAPSPLLHMWTLAVEEQYYLVWPIVAFFVLRRGGPRLLAWVAGVGAAASALLMASMYLAGFSTNRLYFGTDTRSQALFVGSLLGALAIRREWRVVPGNWASSRNGRICGAVLAVCGAGALFWFWHSVGGQSAFLYEGGFLVVALAAGAVITSVTSWRTSVLSRVLSFPPFTYIGRISYGLYLYHWPLFLAIDNAHTGLTGISLLAARLVATFAAAVVSFHLVEKPIRTGRLTRGWRGIPIAAGGAVATAAIVLLATIAPAAAVIPASLTKGSPGLPKTEHEQLEAAHAFTTDPIRFLLFGDSVAATATTGLSIGDKTRYGVDVIDGGVLGCDLDIGPSVLGGVTYPASPTQNCGQWPTLWTGCVVKYRPEVVGLLIGRFELADHIRNGQLVYLGQPAWDAHLVSQLDQAISIFTAYGAHVVIFTFPYIDPSGEQPNGYPWPENLPSRVDTWNGLLRQVASANPSTTTLINLNQMLDPDGHYTYTIDGIAVRWPHGDGIHVSKAGGLYLQPKILPEVAALGLNVHPEQPVATAADVCPIPNQIG
jgi:peptidoglycan/LPS O-acetylase OafA/YrhL